MELKEEFKRCLLGDGTSKLNKIWLVITWKNDGYFVEYQWNAFKEQVKLKFSIDGDWLTSKCFDDVHRAMQDANK